MRRSTPPLELDAEALQRAVRAVRDVLDAYAAMWRTFGRAMRLVMSRIPGMVLIVEDPATWRPTTVRGWLAQAWAIMLHEFWMAADRPARSPGARWVVRR